MTIKSLEELNREFLLERPGAVTRSTKPDRKAVAEKPDKIFKPKKPDWTLTPDKPKKPDWTLTPDKPKKKSTSSATIKARPEKRKIRGALSTMYWILFYVAILLALFAVLTGSSYSFYTVETLGATDEIPKGSLLLVHSTEPRNLKTGDNITYMRNRSTTVIHEIGNIYEDYPESGSRGFGTKNANDTDGGTEILLEENVVGKVVYTIPVIGTAVSWLSENITIVFIVFGLLIVIFLTFRVKQSNKTVALNN